MGRATVIRIFEEITPGLALRVMDALNAADDEGAAVTVWICSRGGDVAAALAMHDAFRRRRGLVAVATGECQSAALLAFLGARQRLATPNTIFMNHRISGVEGECFPEDCRIPAAELAGTYGTGLFGAEEALRRKLIERIDEGQRMAAPDPA